MRMIRKPKKPFYFLIMVLIMITTSIFTMTEVKGREKAVALSHTLTHEDLPSRKTAYSNELKKELNQSFVTTTFNHNNEPLEKPLYLTFDDGPTKDTLHILDVLKQHHVKATFFMLKGQMEQHPDITKQIVAEGHGVGCHGVSHDLSQFYGSEGAALNEMRECLATLQSITHVDSSLIRVPFGSAPYLKEPHRTDLLSHYQMWDWNIDSQDWTLRSASKIIHNILPQLTALDARHETPVLLFHDKSFTAESLPEILTITTKSGYQPITINETMEPLQFKAR
ncbi:polysaccharide deacetylase family protein [Metabacillus iocasae]|uniref:Peptidoglycan/xylan/chitin deacetylase (PgdA/CDA1 family) n=1 Tax=Priestia iocasae TaxID=2291674 RepID=A0ABS2QUS9_9BACI|nr:polysaccharide deacetylase family protein [Metabacillus iocasae]MBM7703214.1 peptidoglycan/xylan/chitin deacetylase (PgdA/CDA1 family) [Metabacillus iocasae]